ncbi:hypothetical protein ABK040_002895 [Willaertia magna]
MNIDSIDGSSNVGGGITGLSAEELTQTLAAKFAQIACSSCRKLHRKCDKLLPSCSYCAKTGKQCVYPNPRRGKQHQQGSSSSTSITQKSKHNKIQNEDDAISTNTAITVSTTNQLFSPGSNSNSDELIIKEDNSLHQRVILSTSPYDTSKIQHELNYKYIAIQSLDLYYNVLSFGFPLIEKEKMLALIENNSNTDKLLWQNKIEKEKNYSVLYGMQSLCLQQLGHLDLAIQLHMKSKTIIGNFFDDVESIPINIAYCFMIQYLLGTGEVKKAKSIASMVKTNVKSSIDESYVENDDRWYERVPHIIPFSIIYSIIKVYETHILEVDEDFGILKAMELISRRIVLDKKKIGSTKVVNEGQLKILMGIMKGFEINTELIFTTMAKKDNLIYLVAWLVHYQLVLQILLRCDPAIYNTSMILNICQKIIDLTKSPHFIYIPIMTTKGIILAIQTRLKHYLEAVNNYKIMIDLKEDLRILRVLSSRYTVVTKEHPELIKTVESIVYTQSITSSKSSNFYNFDQIISNISNNNNNNNNSEMLTEDDILDISAFLDVNNINGDGLLLENNGFVSSPSSNNSDSFVNRLLDNLYDNNLYENNYRSIISEYSLSGAETLFASIDNMYKQQQIQQQYAHDLVTKLQELRKLRLEFAEFLRNQANDKFLKLEADLFKLQVISAPPVTQVVPQTSTIYNSDFPFEL